MAGKYIDVALGEIYLKKIFLSMGVAVDNLDITSAEIDYAETWAENQIDSRLGLTFPIFPATPLIIRDITLLLAAYKLRQFLLAANAPNLDEHTNALRDEGQEMIEDIFHGRRSVIMPDLSFHPRYPGPSGGKRFADQGSAQLRRFFTNMDRPFVTMEQLVEEADGIEQEFHDPVWESGHTTSGKEDCAC
jgi:hypothetical protein